MKIRSVTLFDKPGDPLQANVLTRLEKLAGQVSESYQAAGYEVQTIRFASPPFPSYLKDFQKNQVISYAIELEKTLISLGFNYISLGPALPSFPDSYPLIPEIIEATEYTFCSGMMTDTQQGISLKAVRACGEIIHQLATLDPDGFDNLYFAALGNVQPGAPFFPAAYHDGDQPSFAIAVEAADLAVDSFTGTTSFEEASSQLIGQIEKHGEKLRKVSQELEKSSQATFGGIDFSLAPFPTPDLSIGTALETLGVNHLGDHGSLAAAAFLADTIDKADFSRTGFSGLMLPLLEDAVIAGRAAEGKLGIKDLLLYSAVCGTGLDTIPLPGDTTPDQISLILMDLAALSIRLDKPLTARLMPIPGKKAGEPTRFDFPYFANSKVVEVPAGKLDGLFSKDGYLKINPRSKR